MSRLQVEPTDFLVLWGFYLLTAAATAAWVFIDSGHRGLGGGARFGWAFASFLGLPFAFPAYLLVGRPIGDLVICPACGAFAFRHQPTCAHCGSATAFGGPPPMWGMGDVVGVVTVFMFFLVVVFDASALFGQLMSLPALSLLVVVQNALLVGLAIYVVRFRYRQSLTALGLRWRPFWALVGKGALVSIVALPLSAVAEMAERAVVVALIGPGRAEALAAAEQAKNHLVALVKGSLTTVEITWLFVLVCVLVPIGEEVFFRGFLYGALRARLRLPFAIGLSALIFALVHTAVFTFLPILILGIVLAILYERTGTVLPGIIVHGINNVIALLAVLNGWNV